mgnify:CR=1 FL=1
MDSVLEELSLVCLRCRAKDGIAVQPHALLAACDEGSHLVCRRCSTRFPVVDGVAVLRENQGAAYELGGVDDVQWPPDIQAWCERMAKLDPNCAEFVATTLLGTYGLAHYPTVDCHILESGIALLQQAISELLTGVDVPEGATLELGCGPAGMVPTWSEFSSGPHVLLDGRLGQLRMGQRLASGKDFPLPRRRTGMAFSPFTLKARPADAPVLFCCADALNPPFLPSSFAMVAALNLLDSVPEPWVLLGQISALLRPGGVAVIALPYHYENQPPDPANWIHGPQALRNILSGQMTGLDQLQFEIIGEVDGVSWPLRAHDRLLHLYSVHLVVVRKGLQ